VADKTAERRYFEIARAACPELPPGEPVESESPDFVLQTAPCRVGVEVTKLFQRAPSRGFSRREVEAFRQKVVQQAQRLHEKTGRPAVDVQVWFSAREGVSLGVAEAARAIAELVRANARPGMPVTSLRQGDANAELPSGISEVTLALPLWNRPRAWLAGAAGETLLLERQHLEDVIAHKNALIPRYRLKADEVWLLIACDMFPSSASLVVPDALAGWAFAFDFKRVLVLSPADAKVWSLNKN
jgi:hypothetical protein